jgi:hypothetical protein
MLHVVGSTRPTSGNPVRNATTRCTPATRGRSLVPSAAMVPGTPFGSASAPSVASEGSGSGILDAHLPLSTRTPVPFAAATSHGDGERLLARALRWFRERGRADDPSPLPPLRAPVRPRIRPLRRSALDAWWSAGREPSGIEEFLHGRLAQYLFQSSVPPERLPVEITVETGGRVRAAPGVGLRLPADWLDSYVRANGEPALEIELRRAEAEVARAEAALVELRDRSVAARRDLEDAARASSLVWADGDVFGNQGRPPVPAPWNLAIGAFVAVLVLAEAWQLAVPLLRDAGVAAGDVVAEGWTRPGAIALPLLLSLGASVSIFVFAAVAARRAQAIVQELPPGRRVLAHVIAGAASIGLAAALAWAILGAARNRGVASLLLALSLPFAAPPLLAVARRLHAVRAEALRAAFAWDHAHQAALSRWVRQSALVDTVEREHATIEAARSAWAQRVLAIRGRVAQVERLAAEAAEADARELRRLCDAVVVALELDRRVYARRAPRGSPVP